MVGYSSFANLLCATLLAVPSAVYGFQINFYSDTNCQNYVGYQSGGGDAWSTAMAGIECNKAPDAKSYIAMVDQCQVGIVHFGGQRKFGKELCALNGWTCQWSTTVSAVHNDQRCHSFDNRPITGWQISFNKREGNCPAGFKKRAPSLPYGSEARDLEDEVDFTPEEVIAEIQRRGPQNELEEGLAKRQKITC